VGPVGWALGNALLSLGQWVGARTAFATARDSRTVGLYVEALRSQAALRADTADLHSGLAELDAAIASGQRLAAEAGVG